MGHFFLRYPVGLYFECLVGVIHTYMLSQTDTDIHCVQKKSEPLKDFATCVNLHQIKYIFTHTATCISNDVLKCLGKKTITQTHKSNCKQNHSKIRLHSAAAVNPESDNSPDV